MEYICPLCNGIDNTKVKCSRCGEIMKDNGPIQEYFDEYSPYLDMNITKKVDGVPSDQCMHIFICPKCNVWHNIAVSLIEY